MASVTPTISLCFEDVATGHRIPIDPNGKTAVKLSLVGNIATIRADRTPVPVRMGFRLRHNGLPVDGIPDYSQQSDRNAPWRINGDKAAPLPLGESWVSVFPLDAKDKPIDAGVTVKFTILPESTTPAPAPQKPVTDADKPVPDAGDKDQTPVPRTVIRGTMVEVSAAEQSATDAGFGYNRRLWCKVDWNTGKLASPERVAQANALAAKGGTVLLTVTVPQGNDRQGVQCANFGTAADQLIALGLDNRVVVQLVNEVNTDLYWPGGDIAAALKTFVLPIALKLKAAGYTLAMPSITTGYTPTIEKIVRAIVAASPAGLWTFIDVHLYADLATFKTVFAFVRTLADSLGLKILSSEWSSKIGNDAFAKQLPQFAAVMDQYADAWWWYEWAYIAARNPLNPNGYGQDGKLTVVADAWTSYFRAIAGAVK